MNSVKNVSLFIPHVFPNFSKEYIANTLTKYGIGEVENIDFVAKQDRNGKDFNSVFIYFKRWFNTQANYEFQLCLFDKEREARIYHDGMWYWIVLENTGKKYISGNRKTRIDLGGVNAINTKKTYKDPSILSESMHKFIEKCKIQSAPPNSNIFNDWREEFEAIDQYMEEQENFITIDGRYVKTIEEENARLRNEVSQLRTYITNQQYVYHQTLSEVKVNVIPNDEVK
jgi:hypothetical protein